MMAKIVRLEKSHDREKFECGHRQLNDYLKKQARQDVTRDLSVCFVLVSEHNDIIGYYTLSANSINRISFPESIVAKLPPSYNDIPTVLLGRLAIDKKTQGMGYGKILLLHALEKSLENSKNLGAVAVVVDPIDDNAHSFYLRYGFQHLPGSGKMFIPMKTVRSLFE
jgi:GNAT superfamily N-acetyltransferase